MSASAPVRNNGKKLKVLDLFSGIGGFSLGLERTGGFETIAFCEIDLYCRAVLAKHWPGVPIFEDIRTLRAEHVGEVDIVTGGFPCQRFSTASAGRRTADDLWPEMARLVRQIRPRFVIAENVQERPIRRAEDYFRGLGYRAFRKRVSADECGADHIRNRWWACAYPHDEVELHGTIDAKMAKLPALCRGLWGPANYARAVRISDGIPNRVHRLRALGNAVVPQIPQMIGEAILAAENEQMDLIK